MRTLTPLAAAVFLLSFSACDEKKADPAPVAPVAQPAVPPAAPAEPPKPAEEPAEHAARPAKADEKGEKKDPKAPAMVAPRVDAPDKQRLDGKVAPPLPDAIQAPPPVVQPSGGAADRDEKPLAAGARPGGRAAPTFAQPDGGK